MEKHRKDRIYERVQSDFGVNVFRCYYYCLGLLLENFKRKLKIRHGQECRILVRFDHIVVEESEGEIIVYLLVSHSSRKVKLIVLFIFIDGRVQQANSRIHVLFSLGDQNKGSAFSLLIFFFLLFSSFIFISSSLNT